MVEPTTDLVYDSQLDYGFLDGARDENDYQHFVENSKTDDFSDIVTVLRPTFDELNKMGHTMENFILNCTFDGEPCRAEEFYMIPNRQYGINQ